MEENKKEYITEAQAREVKELFRKHLKSYKEKDEGISDQEWLEQLFRDELPEKTEEEIKVDAREIVTAINCFDDSLGSCNEAANKGISKERWLADKIQEASAGMAVNEYGHALQQMNDVLYTRNAEIAEALARSSDGHIMMSRNLDGNIAEHMVAKSTELSASLQGKNISLQVLESHAANSVDVRAINLDTGKYQNYQLKFGQDAKATIKLIERGNYNNQRIVVPSEQLEEVQAYFKAKGSNKTITDSIDAWGAKGKSFTKAEMKALQVEAQKENVAPQLDYNHYQTKDLALNIGKNAGVMAIQSAAVTTGLTVASKIFNGEEIEPEELVEIAIKTGADTSIKTITAGTLQVAINKGIITIIPKATPAGVIANIACVGIENVKILAKIAAGDLSVTKGLDQMGRVTTSMIGGLWGMAKGTAIGAHISCGVGMAIAGFVPIIGPAFAVTSIFAGAMVGYFGGSKLGESIYSAGKKVASVAKSVAKTAWEGIKSAGKTVSNGIKSFGRAVSRIFR